MKWLMIALALVVAVFSFWITSTFIVGPGTEQPGSKPAATTSSSPAAPPSGTLVADKLETMLAASTIIDIVPGAEPGTLKIIAKGAAGEHYAGIGPLKVAKGPSRLVLEVRPDTSSALRIQLLDVSQKGPVVDIDLATRRSKISPLEPIREPTATVTDAGGGWLRVAIAGTFVNPDRTILVQLMDGAGNASFQPAGQAVLLRSLKLF